MVDNQNTYRYLKAHVHSFLLVYTICSSKDKRRKRATGLIVYYMHIDTDVIKKSKPQGDTSISIYNLNSFFQESPSKMQIHSGFLKSL